VRLWRRKPEEFYAEQLDSSNAEELAEWCRGLVVEELEPYASKKRYKAINVPTLNGVERLSQGQYLLCREGKFSIMGPTKFESEYEEA
jgi:hypothetical protein